MKGDVEISVIYVKNSIIRNNQMSEYAIVLYVILRSMVKSRDSVIYINPKIINFTLSNDPDFKFPDKTMKNFTSSFYELEVQGLIRIIKSTSLSEFYLDLSKLYFEFDTGNFTTLSLDDLIKITNLDCKNKIKILRYYICLVSWFFIRGNIRYGNRSLELLSEETNIARNTLTTYNDILLNNKIIYIYRPMDYLKDGDTKRLAKITNTYGYYCDKEAVFEIGKKHEELYGNKHRKERTKEISKKKSINTKKTKSLKKFVEELRDGKKFSDNQIQYYFNIAVEKNIYIDDFDRFAFLNRRNLNERND